MRSNWASFAEKAIQVPFEWRGRSYEGWDCLGLVYCAYCDVVGVEIKTYLDAYEEKDEKDFRKLKSSFTNGLETKWEEIDLPEEGSVVVILRRGWPIHVGIMISKTNVLHCEEGVGTVIEPVSNMRIAGYFKPK